MVVSDPKSLKNIAVLTQSIEFVVRNLVKILIGKMSLVRLQELLQSIFVEEAENYLRKEREGRDIALTNLAVLTGLDTRKLTQIRDAKSYRLPFHAARQFLDGITPETCVIDLWTSNPRFTVPGTGEPRALDIWGSECSFEILVKEAVRSRGITITSVIERMKRNKQIKVYENDQIELTTTELAPVNLRLKIGDIKLGLDAAGHLLGTVHHNLQAAESSQTKFYQRGSWTHRLDPLKREQMEATAAEFLSETDVRARSVMQPFEEEFADEKQLTAGIGFYYFESETF